MEFFSNPTGDLSIKVNKFEFFGNFGVSKKIFITFMEGTFTESKFLAVPKTDTLLLRKHSLLSWKFWSSPFLKLEFYGNFFYFYGKFGSPNRRTFLKKEIFLFLVKSRFTA
jgi:hypothetical protein